MSAKSRWDTDTAEDLAAAASLKAEKAAKRAAKEARKRAAEAQAAAAAASAATSSGSTPPSKRRKVGGDGDDDADASGSGSGSGSAKDGGGGGGGKDGGGKDRGGRVGEVGKGKVRERELRMLRFPAREIAGCRHVDLYERLNHIEEGSYGVVSRARDTQTGDVVALKKLKLERETDGFPITSLREIQTLMAARHTNVVELREVVMGDSLKDVYIVMDFVEHDLKSLFEDMPEPFLLSETKTLLHQLLSATSHLHANWILHRDLKTSNLLLNNRGQLKIADFGLARYTADPPPALTQLVVTLWYRAPELLLGAKSYGPEIDLWSIGCIFGELLTREPLLQGKNEIDQLSRIFELLGIPTEETWPGFRRLPNAKSLTFPKHARTAATAGAGLRKRYPLLTTAGVELLGRMLTMDPRKRVSADEALAHPFFKEDPKPKAPEMLPTFPSRAGQEKRRRLEPGAPVRGDAPVLEGDVGGLFAEREEEAVGAGFALRMG